MVEEYLPLVPVQQFTVEEIYTVHYFEYGNDYSYPGESHDFWEFCYVDKGEVEITSDQHQFTLHKAEIVFHKPGEFHKLKANGKVAPNLVVASFSCHSPAMSWFNGRLATVGETERNLLARLVEEAADAFLSPLNDPELTSLSRSAGALPGAEQMIKICLETLLIELYRKGQMPQPRQSPPGSLIKETAQQQSISQVVEYLENNISKRLTLSDICRDNLVGRSYLQKIFREKTGGGTMEYFGKLKIEAAKRMIREGRSNFTEISASLGYTSIHYFSRHFKKVTGMTPSEYASSIKVLTSRSRME